MKNFLFIAENELENIEFSKDCFDSMSYTNGFWTKDVTTKLETYEGLSDVYLINHTPNDIIDYKRDVYELTRVKLFNVEFIVVKGSIKELYAVASLIHEGIIECPCFAILDGFSEEFSEYDLLSFDQYNKIFVYGLIGERLDYIKMIKQIGKIDNDLLDLTEKINIIEGFSHSEHNEIYNDKKIYLKEKIIKVIGLELQKNKHVNGCEF
jgi:hypothetical protein